MASASSYAERPLAPDVVVLGEVGLTGEVRAVGSARATYVFVDINGDRAADVIVNLKGAIALTADDFVF